MLQTESEHEGVWIFFICSVVVIILWFLAFATFVAKPNNQSEQVCLEWSTIETGEWKDVRHGRVIRKEQVIYQECLKYKE